MHGTHWKGSGLLLQAEQTQLVVLHQKLLIQKITRN